LTRAIIRQAGEGELMWFAGGGAFRWKAPAAETGGAFLAMEDRMERGKVTPYHLHPEEDEGFYLIDGEILVNVDGEEDRVGPGGFVFLPRGVPHAFMVTSESAHILGFQTPGTGEAFYRAAGETVETEEDAARQADWQRLQRVAAESPSIEVLGPPPFKAATLRS
jgi:quercetin dioxygenase-like cupin family protein